MFRTKTGKAAYSSVEIGLSAIELLLQVYLLELYIVAGLPPLWAGVALVLAVVWDGVSDPLLGALLDRSSVERRLRNKTIALVAGVALTSLSVVVLFSPQIGNEPLELFAQLLIWFVILNTGMTFVGVPHLCLINDLCEDSNDRAAIFGWRLSLGAVGLLVALAMPILFAVESAANSGSGIALLSNRAWSGWGAGLLTVLTGSVTVFSLVRCIEPSNTDPRPGGLSRSIKWSYGIATALRSRSFRITVAAFMALAAGRALNSSLALLFYKHSLGFEERRVSIVLLVLTVSLILSAPLWVQWAKTYDKQKLALGAIGVFSLLTAVVYPLLPPDQLAPVLLLAIGGGFLVASIVLLEAMFSDVVAEDQRAAATPLTGVYYGLWKLMSKCARAGGLLVASLFLAAIGYEEGATRQSESVSRSIAWAFGPGVAVFFVMGALLIARLKGAFSRRESPKNPGDARLEKLKHEESLG